MPLSFIKENEEMNLKLALVIMCLVGGNLLVACNKAVGFQREEDVQSAESSLIPLLMGISDISTSNCVWTTELLFQNNVIGDSQLRGANDFASNTLDGICYDSVGESVHLRLMHVLYLYKDLPPRHSIEYLTYLALNPNWRILEARARNGNDEVNMCATYEKTNYQDCFLISQYEEIVSILWINSREEIPDEFLIQIANDIFEEMDSRLSGFVEK